MWTYEEYLKSDIWSEKRGKYIRRFGGCFVCQSKDSLNVHHLRYVDKQGESILGIEQDKDLVVLCYLCHSSAHQNKKTGFHQLRNARHFVSSGMTRKEAFESSFSGDLPKPKKKQPKKRKIDPVIGLRRLINGEILPRLSEKVRGKWRYKDTQDLIDQIMMAIYG